jgi:hypothetical protein
VNKRGELDMIEIFRVGKPSSWQSHSLSNGRWWGARFGRKQQVCLGCVAF